MPDITAGDYLLLAFEELGRCRVQNGIGAVPVTWSEIAAYTQWHPTIDEQWERQTLYDMSCGYVYWLNKGKDPLSMSPMDIDEQQSHLRMIE